jgi:hypothetical protein
MSFLPCIFQRQINKEQMRRRMGKESNTQVLFVMDVKVVPQKVLRVPQKVLQVLQKIHKMVLVLDWLSSSYHVQSVVLSFHRVHRGHSQDRSHT